ncbi:hypothetical protein NA57DRAFT_63284 [Rhizodiscina lignyota]|uniref:Squalene/phytoene synthase n=1 Tax=Rhizodiscina lignyota TaxID=1504668 RepID=A0A9P4MBX4_9PEZI|nr:hypothetical protein NA57DRAFT_63284 [Rhizodiscina lignyota]
MAFIEPSRSQSRNALPPRHPRLPRRRSRNLLTFFSAYDSPSYTLQTFIPPYARDAYLAIRAFNVDVARVADATSNPTVGSMRMQFWRDAVTKSLAGSPPKEPVAVLLSAANESLQQRTDGKNKLSKAWLHKVIGAREQYLVNPQYADMDALEAYAENTYSTLLYLTLQALPMQSITADHVASHIGKATGIATVLRGLPLIAFPPPPNKHSNQSGFGSSLGGGIGRQGAVTLPLDVMASAGVREEDVFRQGATAPGLKDAVFSVATRANDHLITAREMLKNLRAGQDVGHDFEHTGDEGHEYEMDHMGDMKAERQLHDVDRSFGVLLQAVPAALWLQRLEKVDFDIFDAQLRRTDWKLPWNAFWAFRRRKI